MIIKVKREGLAEIYPDHLNFLLEDYILRRIKCMKNVDGQFLHDAGPCKSTYCIFMKTECYFENKRTHLSCNCKPCRIMQRQWSLKCTWEMTNSWHIESRNFHSFLFDLPYFPEQFPRKSKSPNRWRGGIGRLDRSTYPSTSTEVRRNNSK